MRRVAAAAVVGLIVLAMAGPAWAQVDAPPGTETKRNCELGPLAVPGVVCDVGKVVAGPGPGPVVDVIADGAGDAIAGVARAGMAGLRDDVAAGSKWVVGESVDVILSDTNTPTLDAPWAKVNYNRMRNVAVSLLALFFFAAIIASLRAGAPIEMVKAAFVRLPAATIAMAAAVTITTLAVAVVDNLSGYVSATMRADMVAFVTNSSAAMDDGALPILVSLVGAFIIGLGALLLWLELLVRSAAIYLAVAFLPLSLAASVWPATLSWTKRMVEILAALILAKFVIVGAVALSAAALAASDGSFGSLLAAGGTLILAAFCPGLLFALVRFADAPIPNRSSMPSPSRAMYAAHTGQAVVSRMVSRSSSSRGVTSAGARTASTATTATRVVGTGSGGAGSGPGRAANRPTRVPVGAGAGRPSVGATPTGTPVGATPTRTATPAAPRTRRPSPPRRPNA